ncbi:MAG: phosphatidylinositol mannoside acyltransferase [Actinomycetota bacterium]|nr:MAG: phosphatidylinositol mannoside acyltransferase [Actinomycetota bacterium]
MGQAADALTDAGFALGWGAVRRLPETAGYRVADRIADATWAMRRPAVGQLEANLARVVPTAGPAQLRELSRAGLRSYLRYWYQAFALPAWTPAEILDHVVADPATAAELDRLRDSGEGALLALPHMANWDLAGAWLCLSRGGLMTVAEVLRPQRVFDRFVAYRRSLGMTALPLGDPTTIRAMTGYLKAGGVVCLLADRDLGGHGVPVTFFGQAATMPAGPAVLAGLTGAPLYSVDLWYDGPRLHLAVDRLPVPAATDRQARVAAMTQDLADRFAAGISAHPADWHMMQPLWQHDLASRTAT